MTGVITSSSLQGAMPLTDVLDDPPWLAAGATAASYGLLLVALFVCLFVVPFLVFWLL